MSDHTTDVDIEEIIERNEKPYVKVHSKKHKLPFIVKPSVGGFVFYEVGVLKGNLPKELETKYTSMKLAVDAVKEYVRKCRVSPLVERDRKAEIRHAAKLQRDSKEHVHSGSDNGEE